MSVAGAWKHSCHSGKVEITESEDTVTVDHFLVGTRKVPATEFYREPRGTKAQVTFMDFTGNVEDDVIYWSNGVKWAKVMTDHDLPDVYTARHQRFPDWTTDKMGEEDNWSICFNIKPGDMQLRDAKQTDASYFWEGTYFWLSVEGVPKGTKWSSKLTEIADQNGTKQVEAYVKDKMNNKARAFWSPAKIRRWGKDTVMPDSDKKNDSENLLILEDGIWNLVEVAPDGKPTKYELGADIRQRITYPFFKCVGPLPARMAADVYTDENGIERYSEPAWIDGSTLLRQGFKCPGRELVYVPKRFKSIRYVPLSLRAECLLAISKVPTCALTGATLMPTTQFASPLSKQIAEAVGEEFGKTVKEHGVYLMSSASMRGNDKLMSADHDFTYGFCKSPGCQAVHFKGSNMVALHGEAWEMKHGVSYMFEEEFSDFSNHAKEAALMASLCNERSVSFLANGGPTVAINLSRMLLLCGKNRVFTLTGLHSKGGKSGASGGFPASKEKLESAVDALLNLSPEFFGSNKNVPKGGDAIVAALVSKPLRLLNWDDSKGLTETEYTLKPDSPNQDVYPGIFDEKAIKKYAEMCSQEICKELANAVQDQ